MNRDLGSGFVLKVISSEKVKITVFMMLYYTGIIKGCLQ